ncbi:MAG: GAF domain-containing SpoIIE family protein phosphatase [Syntrophothermus sp.]
MIDTESIKLKRNLTALVEFSRILNSSLDLNFILNNILLTCMGKFLASKGLIALKMDGKIVLKASKGIKNEVLDSFPNLISGDDIIEHPELQNFIKSNNFFAVEKIKSSTECIGILCLNEKLNHTPYSEEDIEFLKTILNIAATAIQNSQVLLELTKVNRILDSRIHRLNSLFELSKEFGIISDSNQVAKILGYSVIGQFLISKYAIITFDPTGIKILESKFNKAVLLNALKKYNLQEIDDTIFTYKIKDEYTELNSLGIQLIVPMQIHGETKGLILLGNRISNMEFTLSDVEYIYSAGSLAIISLENRRLFKEALDKQKMEEELEIAREIQVNLLPHSIPAYNKIEISASNLSSKQVGGDYYDVIPLDENNFCVSIADVSGKSVPAALLMANLQAFLKIICKHGMELEEATALINDLICENTSDGRFITFFWAIVEENTCKLQYVNAGHNPPLLYRNGKLIKLDKGGMILGVMKTLAPYNSEEIELQKDDVLVMYTDGVTEAKNLNDDEYGDERLEELIKLSAKYSSPEILSAIQKDVQLYSTGVAQSDDITLVVLKIK